MGALLNQINTENGFKSQDDQKEPCRCAAHQEPRDHAHESDEVLDHQSYAELTKACTFLMRWLQNTIKRNQWEKVMIEVNASIPAIPWIYPSNMDALHTNVDGAGDINALHRVFGLEPAKATSDLTNGTVEMREGVKDAEPKDPCPDDYAELTNACTTMVTWVQELCRQRKWQEVEIVVKPEGLVCPYISMAPDCRGTKASLRAETDDLRNILNKDPCPDDQSALPKACTFLMRWLRSVVKRNHLEKVVIEIKPYNPAIPWIHPTEDTNADGDKDINTLHRLFGLKPPKVDA